MGIVDMVKTNGAGRVNYLWPKPGSSHPVPKVSYVTGFAPWDVFRLDGSSRQG